MNRLERLSEGFSLYLDIMEEKYLDLRKFTTHYLYLTGGLTTIDFITKSFLPLRLYEEISFNLVMIFWGWMVYTFARTYLKVRRKNAKK
jgi:hypothetical protein